MYIVLRRFCKKNIYPGQKTIRKHPLTLISPFYLSIFGFLAKIKAAPQFWKEPPLKKVKKGEKKKIQLSFWQNLTDDIQSPSTAEVHFAQQHHRHIMDIFIRNLAPLALACCPLDEVCHILPAVEPWWWRFLLKVSMIQGEMICDAKWAMNIWIFTDLPHLTVSTSRPSRWYISQTKLKDFTSASSIFGHQSRIFDHSKMWECKIDLVFRFPNILDVS